MAGWQGIDRNEAVVNRVRNALVSVILDGVSGVSPQHPGHEWRQISPEEADAIIARGQQALADLEGQAPAPGGARGRGQKWMAHAIGDLKRLVTDAEAVRSGARPQKQTPESYDTLRKSLGVGERHSPRGHRVADFNTLDDLVEHARAEGATHVLHIDDEVHLYFQRRDGSYEKSEVWQKDGYWHTQGPGSRVVVRRPPSNAQAIGGRGGAVRSNVAAHRDPVDEQAATELVMFIENESDLSPDGPQGQGQSVRMNALRKWRAGTYDPVLAVKLFEYLAESGAKRYAKEFASPKEWNTIFNPATRHEAARQLEASFRNSVENGEYDQETPRTVRDYEAVDNRDRHIAGPFKSYSDARSAAGTAGVVKFVPSRGKPSRATEVNETEKLPNRLHDAFNWIDSAGEWREALAVPSTYATAAAANARRSGERGVTRGDLIEVIEWVQAHPDARGSRGPLLPRFREKMTESRDPSRSAHRPTRTR